MFVTSRQDRTLLMGLFEQGPPNCQVRADAFGDEDAVAEPTAGNFMKKLGKL